MFNKIYFKAHIDTLVPSSGLNSWEDLFSTEIPKLVCISVIITNKNQKVCSKTKWT